MALTRLIEGLYESPNFRMIRQPPRWRTGTIPPYVIEPRTEAGQALLSGPSPPAPSRVQRARIAEMERRIRYGSAAPRHGEVARNLQQTLVDGRMDGPGFVAVMSVLFPGVGLMQARRKLAAYLGMSVGHIRHMESGRKGITSRTVRLLRAYATQVLHKDRGLFKAEEKALEPFAELYAALATEDEEDGDGS